MSGSLYLDAFQYAQAEYEAACEAEPLIEAALDRAAKAEGELRLTLVGVAAERLAPLAPSLPIEAWRSLLLARVTGAEARTTYVPGIPGQTVWVIRDAADAAAMRAAVSPGQVWVRADELRVRTWPTARAVASHAVAADLGTVAPSGRPQGSTNRRRDELVAAVRVSPDMSDETIDVLGIALGIWADATGDYDTVGKRVRRLRMDAGRTNNP